MDAMAATVSSSSGILARTRRAILDAAIEVFAHDTTAAMGEIARAAEVGRWVDGYRSDHGHGPSWSTVAEHFGWPPRSAPDHDVTQEIFERLGRRGVLTGFGVPFGLRPGAALSREDAA